MHCNFLADDSKSGFRGQNPENPMVKSGMGFPEEPDSKPLIIAGDFVIKCMVFACDTENSQPQEGASRLW